MHASEVRTTRRAQVVEIHWITFLIITSPKQKDNVRELVNITGSQWQTLFSTGIACLSK